jgi:hypothetical protein
MSVDLAPRIAIDLVYAARNAYEAAEDLAHLIFRTAFYVASLIALPGHHRCAEGRSVHHATPLSLSTTPVAKEPEASRRRDDTSCFRARSFSTGLMSYFSTGEC